MNARFAAASGSPSTSGSSAALDQLSYDWSALLRACQTRALQGHLATAPLSASGLLQAAVLPRPDEPYGRLAVFRESIGEVLLVRWRENTFCAPHDHGDASGFIVLLHGRFVERLWRWRDGDLVPAGERRYAAPAIIAVTSGAIHDMKARDAGLAIHLYLPAIRGMKVFDRQRRRTLTVRDDCGAWIPHEAALIEGTAGW